MRARGCFVEKGQRGTMVVVVVALDDQLAGGRAWGVVGGRW